MRFDPAPGALSKMRLELSGRVTLAGESGSTAREAAVAHRTRAATQPSATGPPARAGQIAGWIESRVARTRLRMDVLQRHREPPWPYSGDQGIEYQVRHMRAATSSTQAVLASLASANVDAERYMKYRSMTQDTARHGQTPASDNAIGIADKANVEQRSPTRRTEARPAPEASPADPLNTIALNDGISSFPESDSCIPSACRTVIPEVPHHDWTPAPMSSPAPRPHPKA